MMAYRIQAEPVEMVLEREIAELREDKRRLEAHLSRKEDEVERLRGELVAHKRRVFELRHDDTAVRAKAAGGYGALVGTVVATSLALFVGMSEWLLTPCVLIGVATGGVLGALTTDERVRATDDDLRIARVARRRVSSRVTDGSADASAALELADVEADADASTRARWRDR
ncbi:MAG: hypothetical protein KC657_11425 [Myxococcales bacterium]|nr:hypothetical protein [Myxococcales bacterium]